MKDIKKLVIAGGTGFLGESLIRHFETKFDEIIILSRSAHAASGKVKYVKWDAENLGEWTKALEGAEALINLCGKSVDCRYTEKNKALIFSSRLVPTALLGKAIREATNPPAIWLNAASATIYRHSEDVQMTEDSKEIGEGFSVEVCKAWEKTFLEAQTPQTKKVIMRITMVMGKEGGVFPVMSRMVKLGLGGKLGSGRQMVSWIHIDDFCRLVEWAIQNKQEGVYNFAAPGPVSNKEFMKQLRKAYSVLIGLPASKWMLEIGAFIIRTETELILKSRNVIPARALAEGFSFNYPDIKSCISNLAKKS